MKLYYSPGACSLSPHIALHEAGLKHEAVKVDLREKKTASGANYLEINPKGSVPALELDNGFVLTEGPAIVQYIADQAPEKNLAPPNGTQDRYQTQALLNFISTEFHKSFSPLFKPTTPDDYKKISRDSLKLRFESMDKWLAERAYLLDGQFTVADPYFYVMLTWAEKMKIDLSAFHNLAAFRKRIEERSGVQAALKHEAAA